MAKFPKTNGFFEVDHTADVAVAVSGDSLENLFRQSLLALRDIAGVEEKEEIAGVRKFLLNSSTLESILVGFLNEVIFA